MNWDDNSDFEINKQLAILLGFDVPGNIKDNPFIFLSKNMIYSLNMDGTRKGKAIVYDYCNSWADMGPLIVEYEICLLSGADCNGLYSAIADIDYWSGMNFQHKKPETHMASGIQAHDKNPLRAAAICLIKKLEAEK